MRGMNIGRIGSFRTCASLALALLATAGPGAAHLRAAQKDLFKNAPLRNYGVIWPHELTRSGLPRNEQGWIWLREQGVRSIVTFRTEHEVNYREFGFQNVMRIPLTGSVMPTEKQAVEYLKFIQDPANQPVHIHCAAGRSRTGLMAALARYSIDGWSLDNALDEARQYRDGKQLSAAKVAWLRAWAKAHPPGSFKVDR